MTELTLPAGSLQSALHAFAGGADAVYLGLQNYSARKGATNFSWEDLSRLKTESLRLKKKVYVTINTLLDDTELLHARKLCRRLELIHPDGVIVQVLGLARLIAHEFPSLALHGSTQLAVHTIGGVQELHRLGFQRVVLSRELTFKEITHIRNSCPDIELKTFIHGAMCYGFSGLCMASHTLTGRSANRGACAQICRTWFSNENSEGYFFSMTDLAAREDVIRLRDIGIDSLKVEGRMKSPEYVRFAAQYYRMLLDGKEEYEALRTAREQLELQFARQSTGGWAFSYGKEKPRENRHNPSLVTTNYPGHLGIAAATVIQGRSSLDPPYIIVSVEKEISIRDGLLFLVPTKTEMPEPIRFALQGIRSSDGKRLFIGKEGSKVAIDVPREVIASPGDPLYLISRHDLNLPAISEVAIALYQTPIDHEIIIMPDAIQVCAKNLPNWMGQNYSRSYPIETQPANKPQQMKQNLINIFSSPGESLVTLGSLTIVNKLTVGESEIFLPLSQLKEIRRTWYANLNQKLRTRIEETNSDYPVKVPKIHSSMLPPRVTINPPNDPIIPWVDIKKAHLLLTQGKPVEEILAIVDDIAYIPLPPVTFEEDGLLNALDTLIDTLPIQKSSLRIGLNNIGHVQWARKHQDIPCFADIYLYMTNALAAQCTMDSVPSLVGMYRWIERNSQDTTEWPIEPSRVGSDFLPPLFISRACYRYDTLKLPCEGCPRHGSWSIQQNENRYRVDVRNCLTVISKEPE